MKGKININRLDDSYIKITFDYDPDIVSKIKTVDGRWYHRNERYWRFPNSKDTIDNIIDLFGRSNVVIAPETGYGTPVDYEALLADLLRELKIRHYSRKTIKAYTRVNIELLKMSGKKPEEIDNEDVKNYLYRLADVKKAATSTLNGAINAIRFYYGTMLRRNFIYDIKRPKKDKKLPVTISIEEVRDLISSVDNLKHKTLLMLTYSGGLRVSEAVGLKPGDVDTHHNNIFVRKSKGRKDRITILSKTALKYFNEYVEMYKPVDWLFPGAKPGRHLTTKSANEIFRMGCMRANINREGVHFHSLRHSFATHLIESGYDIRVIQELMGHRSIQTTEIYTHVSNKFIRDIKSPLDDLDFE